MIFPKKIIRVGVEREVHRTGGCHARTAEHASARQPCSPQGHRHQHARRSVGAGLGCWLNGGGSTDGRSASRWTVLSCCPPTASHPSASRADADARDACFGFGRGQRCTARLHREAEGGGPHFFDRCDVRSEQRPKTTRETRWSATGMIKVGSSKLFCGACFLGCECDEQSGRNLQVT